jgi:RHS repeat-associated protein
MAGGVIALPAISTPKGGGAIRGIGEKFAANPVTGSGSVSVPLGISPGRSGFGPQLALAYDSGAGNGVFGFGWGLSLPSITRKTDKGLPRYEDRDESDVFILSGAEDLVPVLVGSDDGWAPDEPDPRTLDDGSTWTVERYRPRVEGLFARIERWTDVESGQTHWRSISKDNVTTLYGRTEESRIADPDDAARRVFSWLICESRDDRGNAVLYCYRAENGDGVDTTLEHEQQRTAATRGANRHLKRVLYGNTTPCEQGEDLRARDDWRFEVVLDYGEHDLHAPGPRDAGAWLARADPFSSYRASFEVRTYRLCRRVLMFHHFPAEPDVGADCLVRSTDLGYRGDPIGSFLTSVTQRGYRRGDGYVAGSFPPLEFDYTEAVVRQDVRAVDADSVRNLPAGVDGRGAQWVDLDGEGLPGILSEQAAGWFYHRNLSPLASGDGDPVAAFASMRLVAERPVLADLGGGRQQLLDLAGDGQLDLVTLAPPLAGFSERTDDEGWRDFAPFPSMPNVSWSDPNLRFIDLTGDGHADVLIAGDGAFTWHPSLGEDGFAAAERISQAADEERGPRLVFADGTESIQLADLSGDGLVDLIRIRNGEVCYWPNLGYGRFGPRVAMDQAPLFDRPELFDPRRLRLADVDGSGPTDIIYLGRDGVRLYVNQSGNSWSEGGRLADLPPIDDVSSVQVVDLLGNGTGCLVWSSPLPADAGSPLRFVDLMGGRKPHLLVGVRNNLGAQTRVTYAPSTRFYLEDRRAGTPWVTRLPFPVHVVERVETRDLISRNRFVTRHAYHHPYFDGEEREFRGFALVEQWDTEEFAALSAGDADEAATNLDFASNVPPVHVKTWFHTGAHLDGNGIARRLQRDYYVEGLAGADAQRMLLPDTVLPATVRVGGHRVPYALSAGEEREAARALKGSMLRQEVYAEDGTEAASRPYSVTERNHTVELLQPRVGNRHAVFLAHPRETVDLQYERTLYEVDGRQVPDPRVTHALVLDVDEFGNVLESVAAAYGRRHDDPDAVLGADDRRRQKRALVTWTSSAYTDPVDEPDAVRAPMACETRTWELLGAVPDPPPSGGTAVLSFDALTAEDGLLARLADGNSDVAYEDLSRAGPRRRLVEHVRLVYRRDDLGGPLRLGRLESRALPYDSYRLAFRGTLLGSLYRRRHGAGTEEDLIPDPAATLGAAGYVRTAELTARGVFPATDPEGDWWVPSGRIFYGPDPEDPAQELVEARRHFFLPRRHEDAFGAAADVSYDGYDLLVLQTRDAAGNTVTVGTRDGAGTVSTNGNDYRVLQPRFVTDPNRNRSEVVHDALGLVVATAVVGKPGQLTGDTTAGVDPDLSAAAVAADLRDPLGDPHPVLQGATTRLVHDLFAYSRTRDDPQPQPATVHTLARVTHESDLRPNERTKVQHTLSYSDGFGREIQRKVQAEPDPQGAAQWVGSGWTIFDNKGQPVRQYEPFFSSTPGFEFARVMGVGPIFRYDPLGRLVVTVHPNHTYEKVVFDAWHQRRWDVNDTAAQLDPRADPDVGPLLARLPAAEHSPTWLTRMQASADAAERAAASATRDHAGTPTTSWFDPLGRAFLAVTHNRFRRDGLVVEERYRTLLDIDIEGNVREVVDARGRSVVRTGFDMLGRRATEASMEAGERWTLPDVLDAAVLHWDSSGHLVTTDHDALRRPVAVRLRAGTADEVVVQRTVYGESRPDPETGNLRGQVVQVLDAAGELTTDDYDVHGLLRRSARRLALAYTTDPDWSAPVPLEPEAYETTTRHDALGRPIEVTTPDGSVLRPVYNEANLLERLAGTVRGAATPTGFVDDVDYDAKGRPTRVVHGNGARTDYAYDLPTSRLTHVTTTRGADALQRLRYTHDPAGNVTHVRDDTQQTLFFANRLVDPSANYTYDAVYRLAEATGRAHLGQSAGGEVRPGPPDPHPADGTAMARYTERYTYDQVGNLLELRHTDDDPARTPSVLRYAYEEGSLLEPTRLSNRLTSTTPGAGPTAPYTYDGHGNVTSMPHLPVMRWDHRDQLRASSRQRVDPGATPETTYYVYDAAGQRVRKVTERYADAGATPTRLRERIYLGALEIQREYDGTGTTVTLERETLHVVDGSRRIALVETRTAGTDPGPARLTRYQLTDQLGSTCLELDGSLQALVISRIEYLPYGGIANAAVRGQTQTPPRYGYTGKERDEESGLSYHGARYYAPWLGRWTSCDPAGIRDGPGLYTYCRDNPVSYADPDGRQATGSGTFLQPFIASGRYGWLHSMPGYTREHIIPGSWLRYALEAKYGAAATGMVQNRLYRNAWTSLLDNRMAGPKTSLDVSYAADLRAQGKHLDVTDFYLRGMSNLEAGGKLSPQDKALAHETALREVATYVKGERFVADAAAGRPVQRDLSAALAPSAAGSPAPAAASAQAVPVVSFPKGAAAAAPASAPTAPPARASSGGKAGSGLTITVPSEPAPSMSAPAPSRQAAVIAGAGQAAAVALPVLIAAVSSYGASQQAKEAFVGLADQVEALRTPSTGVLVVANFRNTLQGDPTTGIQTTEFMSAYPVPGYASAQDARQAVERTPSMSTGITFSSVRRSYTWIPALEGPAR